MLTIALVIALLLPAAEPPSRLDNPNIKPFSDSGWGYTLDVPVQMNYVLFQVEHLSQFYNEDEELELVVDANVVDEDLGTWDIFPMPPGYEGKLVESRELSGEELRSHGAFRGHRADYIVPTSTATAGISILMLQVQWTVFTVAFSYPLDPPGNLSLARRTLDSFRLLPDTYYFNIP